MNITGFLCLNLKITSSFAAVTANAIQLITSLLHLTLDMIIYHSIYFNVTLLDVPLSFIYFSLITHRLSLESTDRLEWRHGEKRNFVVFPVFNDQVSTLSETFSFNREQIFGKCRQKSESSAREHFILGKTKRKRNDRKSN